MSKTMRSYWTKVCVGIALVATAGCTFTVTFPAAMQTTSQDFAINGSDQLVITVRFSADVNMNSLSAGVNVILDTELDNNAAITITPGATGNEIIITSVDVYGDLLEFNPDGFFTLYLHGSGANPIRDTEGNALDGDADGTAGGTYETTFVLIG